MAFGEKKKKRVYYSNIFKTPEMVYYYRTHIVEFVEDFLLADGEFISEQQKEGILAIQNNDRVAIKSGKGVGKTGLVSFVIIWFMSCFDNPKVICTAPTFPTLKTALWPEVALWLGKSILSEIFTHTETSMYLTEKSKNWFTLPRAAKDADAAQGAHAENLLVIMDESSGVKQAIYEAFDSTMTGKNNKFVMIGNPTRTSGPFFDAFHRFKHKWFTLTFNGEESPFVKQEQVDYYAEKYGKTHDLYNVMVRGLFPSGDPDSFMRLDDVAEAVERWEDVKPVGEVEIGVDVARFGDDLTVLYWRHGYKVYPAKILAKNSIPEVVQLVLDTVVEIRKRTGYDKKIRVKVDDSGVGCVTKNTQILTTNGWKYPYDIKRGDKLYSKNSFGDVVVEEVLTNDFREETRIIRNKDGIEFSWSHLLPYKVRKEHKFKLSNWEEILRRQYFIFDNDFKWVGEKKDLVFDNQIKKMPYGGESFYNNALNLRAEDLAVFLGWYLSEGCLEKKGAIKITQVKEQNLTEIEDNLKKIGKVKKKKNDFIVYNRNLYNWILENCYDPDIKIPRKSERTQNCFSKKIPNIIKNSTKEIIDLFLETFMKGDGHIHHGRRVYTTTGKTLSDDLLECIYKIGKYGNKYIKQKSGSKSSIHGREITRTQDCWAIFEYAKNNITYKPKKYRDEHVEYYDNVYHITITGDTKLFYTRCNNNYRAFWTHNGGCSDYLKLDREHNIEVIACNFGGAGNDKYQNEATIMWANIKDNIKYIGLPDEETLVEEIASRKWKLSVSGKIMLESKADYKKEFKKSPDRADALVLCFAQKKVENVVLKNLDILDNQTVQVLQYTGDEKFCSIFYSKEMKVSITYTAWDGVRLYVYDEYSGDDSILRISTHIMHHNGITRVVGNEPMFSSTGTSLEDKYRKLGIRIKENYDYDEISSIENLMSLTTQKRLVIHPNCKNTIDQLSSWKMDGRKSEQEREYGICYSLAQITHYLRRKLPQPYQPVIQSSYNKNDSFENNIFTNNWMYQ